MTPREPASGVTGRPTGTVTFVFTDIEGSTRLWQDHPQAMKTAVADHDRIIRTIADEHGGYIFSTGGDGFSIAFTHPLEAALAALDTQTALTDHDWGEVGDLRVRIALDTGLTDERDGDYFGPALSRVARILDQTTGGEILTSNTTADLLTHQLPLGHQLERVGRHHLKDVDGVTTLHRLVSTSATGPRSPLRRPLAATILTVLAITIGWVIFGLLPTEEPPTDGGSGTDTTGTTVQADTDVLWTVELGPLTTSPIIVGDYVIASPDTDTRPVVALYLDTGYEAWTTPMDHVVTQLSTDGEYVYVTTRRRLDVLHPASGYPMPGCGFDLPLALSRTALGDGAVFIAGGNGLYRVDTQPEATGCHTTITENVDGIDLDVVVGPIFADDHVLVTDRRAWYLFDASDLESLRPRGVELDNLGYASGGLAVWDQEFRMGMTRRIAISLVDEKGLLRVWTTTDSNYDDFQQAAPIQLEAIEVSPATHQEGKSSGEEGIPKAAPLQPPVVAMHEDLVITQDADKVIAVDSATGMETWSLPVGQFRSRFVATNDYVVVPTENELIRAEIATGKVIARFPVDEPTTFVVAHSGVLVAASRDGSLTAYGSRTSGEGWTEPREREAADPEAVARAFWEAWNRGDQAAAKAILSPGAYVGDKALQWTWLERRQATLWAWMAHDQVMESEWTVGVCEAEVRGSETRLVCDATYSDLLFEVTDRSPAAFGLDVTVRNGAITRLTPGRLVTSLRGAGPLADYGARDLYQSLHAWAASTFGEDHLTACGTTVITQSTETCAMFVVEHLEEWAASTRP